MKKFKMIILSSTISILCGCTAVADMAGYDSQTMNAQAQKSYSQVVRQAKQKRVLDTRSRTARRVQKIFKRMVPYASQQTPIPFNWKMNVIRSKELNAWAMPGGKMAVYTGMIEKLHLNDDEIAAIIGHEMTHAIKEHSKKDMGQKIITGLAVSAVGSVVEAKTGVSSSSVNLAQNILSQYGIDKPFSRSQESEADIGGLLLMAKSGYNPNAAISVWEKMNKINNNNTVLNSLISTHPTNNDRIANIRNKLPELMPIYKQARKRYK